MIEVGQLVKVVLDIFKWLSHYGEGRVRDRAALKQALLKVYLAANETRAYLATLKRRKEADRDRERMLSRLWSEAAVELSEIHPGLADRSLLEGHYWADPTDWSDTDLQRARDAVKSVFEEARGLLKAE